MAAEKTETSRTRAPGLNLPRALRDCLGTAVLVMDPSGSIVARAGDLEELLGTAPTKPSCDSLADLPVALREIAKEAQLGESVWRREIQGAAGAGRHLLVSAVPFSHPGGRGVVLMLGRRSGGAGSEAVLQRLDRLASVGTLAAGLAHEMRNALVASKTFIDLLLEKNQDAELAEVVRRELLRIDSLVARILKYASPAQPSLGPVHLHQVLDHAFRLVQHQFQTRGISVQRSYAAEPDLLQADAYQLEQVFVNLLLNALDALRPGGRFQISTNTVAAEAGVPGGESQICVLLQDDGTGVAPEILEQVFEPFFTTKPEGTGLGLAMSRRAVLEHGGRIRIESRPGHGTAVRVWLPLLGEDALSDGPG